MARRDLAAKRTLDFTVGFYFGDRYRPDLVRQVFKEVRPHLKPVAVQCFFESISTTDVTFAAASGLRRWGGTATILEPDDPRFDALVQTKFVERIQAVHGRTGREVTLRPWISTDNTVVIEVLISLYDREEQRPVSQIVEATWQAAPLIEMLDKVNPLWGSLEVAGPGPTLGSVRKGEDNLPYCGYWGSKLVNLVGRQRLVDSLRLCPKVVECPNGGVFLCWDWHGWKSQEAQGFERFRKLAKNAIGLLSAD